MTATFWPPVPPWPVKKRPPSRRRDRDCMDCGVDTSFATGNGHYYTVRDPVWLQAVPSHHGALCLHCLEKRLGRPLADDDFVATPYDIFCSMFGAQDL
jgi:hypothetical protein